jgi:hypothetical protein
LPAPEGPTIEVTFPSGTPVFTPLRISTPPVVYHRLETLILRPTLEHFPSQVGVETVIEGIGVMSKSLVVGEGELHTTNYRVEAL